MKLEKVRFGKILKQFWPKRCEFLKESSACVGVRAPYAFFLLHSLVLAMRPSVSFPVVTGGLTEKSLAVDTVPGRQIYHGTNYRCQNDQNVLLFPFLFPFPLSWRGPGPGPPFAPQPSPGSRRCRSRLSPGSVPFP